MHYTNEWDARLAWASFPVFRHWSELMGGPPVFTHTGFVNVVAPAFADHLRKNVEMLRGIGVNTRAITPAELLELQPFANVDDIGAAAYEPESGYANPAETVEGFRRRTEELGGKVMQWTSVTKIDRRDSKVLGVETTRRAHRRGRHRPGGRRVVAAHLPRARHRPPRASQGHRHGGGHAARPTCPRTWCSSTTCRATTSGRRRAGSRSSACRARSGTSIQTRSAPAYRRTPPGLGAQLVTRRIPAMERATLARGYRAFDGYSVDRHAILGAVDGVDGLYLATAFSGSGFKIAPAVGMCMAELITEGRAKTVDIDAFNLRRFAEGKTVEGPYPYATRPDHRDPAASQAR